MTSSQSSSAQFIQHFESLGGTKANLAGVRYLPSPDETVDSVVSGLRMENVHAGRSAGEPALLHAMAQVLISRRDELHPEAHPGSSRAGEYQLEIYGGAGPAVRIAVPSSNLAQAKAWSKLRIDAVEADFAAIYFPTGGSTQAGTGALECSYSRQTGWHE